ncbi:hypothetical protein [Actinoplanes sp. NPDC051851]|uniref:5'-methylthioadenosine/S-adenosylhomocysteine nucleosidase family protein n=1 Tax=Actinoplanes sp. NPDC051851 TaxID=3154753 RepID=UPI003427B87A
MIYLAAGEGRLVGRSADAFVVIEPPIARKTEWARAMKCLPLRVRLLSRVARAWEYFLPWGSLLIAVIIGVPMALAGRGWALIATALILCGMVPGIADLLVGVVRTTWSLGTWLRTGPSDAEIIGAEMRGYHWTINLLHATEPAAADRMAVEAFERSAALTAGLLPADAAFGSGLLAFRAAHVTDPQARNALGTLESVTPYEGTDWFLVGVRGRWQRPPDRAAVRPLGGLRLMVVATVMCLAATAQVVALQERGVCPDTDCGDRPVTFQRALIWTLEHLVFRFQGPATWQSQVLGGLALVATFVMARSAVAAVSQRVRYQQARRKLMENNIARMAAEPTVAILVVNEIERDAVVEAFCSRSPGLVPKTVSLGKHAVHLLGSFGGARIVLAQSEQATIGAGAMPRTADNLINKVKPTFVVLTGVCYGLKSREIDGGTQEIGDIVVSTQMHAADHRKVTTLADGSRHEIGRGPRPEPASGLLSHARALTRGRPKPPEVHFGPVLSSNTLLNNREERERLCAHHEEAVGGEMELAGLHAVAAEAKCDWILIKGISDWGVQKADGDQPLAARNAAEFVADLIAQIQPGEPGD